MFLTLLATAALAPLQTAQVPYQKLEYRIPMRDGTKMYCAAYVPKGMEGKHPILLERTPYSAGPYGPDKMPFGFGGSPKLREAGYIFAYSDVRGRFMSEGKFVEIRPLLEKPAGKQFDEATDAYDTIDYLVKNVPSNNGKVGIWGISYPGFYAAAAAKDSHPALKAISPQAPVSEWWHGDDVHHHGAFFLQDNFDFYFFFGYDKPGPAEDHPNIEPMGPRPDAYKWFLEQGSSEDLERKFYKGRIPFWNEIMDHPAYDDYWKARSAPPKLKNVNGAVLVVGGWFDAEDLYGSLDTYRHLVKQNPKAHVRLVMGPWQHGGWAFGNGSRFGPLSFDSATSSYFRDEIEFPFFEEHLRGITKRGMVPPVTVFETGGNRWHDLAQWPPAGTKPYSVFLGSDGKVLDKKSEGFDSFATDPSNPIPYQPGTIRGRSATYMVADQRFLADRTDILRWHTEPFAESLTFAGPVTANLKVQTSTTDQDFIVKVVDEFPDGTQALIRWEVMRGRFRNDPSKPEPFSTSKVESVKYSLPDMYHTFLPGHRLMVQVQSSWFPLIDRNPCKFEVNPYRAKPEDFIKSTVKIFHDSSVEFTRLGQ